MKGIFAMTNLGYNPETGEKIEYTWTQYEYEGLLIQLRDDGREYSIKDFSKVLNEPVTVGGGNCILTLIIISLYKSILCTIRRFTFSFGKYIIPVSLGAK